MLKDFLGDDDPAIAYEKFKSTVPLGRLAEPNDVANACLFLSSEEANFITGVMLEVDGGRTI
jgi:3-oxoacyl-[acyl-carrier protein] reductase